MSGKLLEIAANSLESAIVAEAGGADRIELFSAYSEGGITPSLATIQLSKERLKIPVYVMIRPRGGNFLYSDLEFEIMKRDIEICKQHHCEGVVFGILNNDATVDKKRNKELVTLASPMKCTFHRAFDECSHLEISLEDVIVCGFERILTSGGKENCLEGIEIISRLVQQAGSRIIVMPGAGINPDNIETIVQKSLAKEFHASAKKSGTSPVVSDKDIVETLKNKLAANHP